MVTLWTLYYRTHFRLLWTQLIVSFRLSGTPWPAA